MSQGCCALLSFRDILRRLSPFDPLAPAALATRFLNADFLKDGFLKTTDAGAVDASFVSAVGAVGGTPLPSIRSLESRFEAAVERENESSRESYRE